MLFISSFFFIADWLNAELHKIYVQIQITVQFPDHFRSYNYFHECFITKSVLIPCKSDLNAYLQVMIQNSFLISQDTSNYYISSPKFWDISACRPLQVNWRFEGICLFHLKDQRISQTSRCDGFLIGLFDYEDRNIMFLRNFVSFSRDYIALYPTKYKTLRNHRCEGLKSYVLRYVLLFTVLNKEE